MIKSKVHVKKNDSVMVIAGKEKGKMGKIIKVIPEKNRVVVEKLNIVKRHMRPSLKYPQGGIIEKEGTIHASNVMILCDKCSSPVRTGKKVLEDGRKVRFCKKCLETLD